MYTAGRLGRSETSCARLECSHASLPCPGVHYTTDCGPDHLAQNYHMRKHEYAMMTLFHSLETSSRDDLYAYNTLYSGDIAGRQWTDVDVV